MQIHNHNFQPDLVAKCEQEGVISAEDLILHLEEQIVIGANEVDIDVARKKMSDLYTENKTKIKDLVSVFLPDAQKDYNRISELLTTIRNELNN